MPAPVNAPFQDYEVLVCTCNGAAYIVEQLRSILDQEPPPSRVLISDDGSHDDTLTLVSELSERFTVPVDVRTGPGKGVVHNVLSALPHTRAPYVFLADQDDVWLPGKAARFCELMNNEETPHLIFSDAWVWTPETGERESFWRRDGLIPENAHDPTRLVFHNSVQGASACINRALIERAEWNEQIVMHDWWLALIASGTGRVDIIAEPTLLYRQHGANQIGSQGQTQRKRRKLSETLTEANKVLCQGAAFAERYRSDLPVGYRGFFLSYQGAIRGNRLQRLGFILRYRPKHRTLKQTLKLWAGILLVNGTSCESP
jgi:rhamnosyltransferase